MKQLFKYFMGLSFIGITLFVLLLRPVIGNAQQDLNNGEYYNEETMMFQYDENGDVVIDRNNYNFQEQGQIFGTELVNEYDENGNVIGQKRVLKVVSTALELVESAQFVADRITSFFGIAQTSNDTDDYDMLIYDQYGNQLYDLRLVYENLTGIETNASISGAGAFEFPWITGLIYYKESQTYYKTYALGPIQVNLVQLTETELLQYLQEHYPDYLN